MHGLDAFGAADALADPEQDGLTNLPEFLFRRIALSHADTSNISCGQRLGLIGASSGLALSVCRDSGRFAKRLFDRASEEVKIVGFSVWVQFGVVLRGGMDFYLLP